MFKFSKAATARLLVITMIMGIFFSSISPISFASGNTYYVAANGSDNNSGSISAPLKTIQKAVLLLKAGDTLLVRAGTYKEKVTLKNSGSSNSLITIKNYPGEKAIISGTGSGGANLLIENKSYIRIEGLDITDNSGKDTPIGISVKGFGTDIELVNNKVYNIVSNKNAHGIAVYGTNSKTPITNLLIEGNEVFNCKLGQSESVVLNGNVTKFKVINNKVHDNDNIAIDFIGYEGTAGSGETDRARDGVCSGNIIYNISSIKNPTYNDYAADGIYVDGGKDIIIEGNYVKNCDIGIEMASEHKGKTTDNITVRNNLILDSTNYAALVFGGEGKSNGIATNIKIYNNTVYNADTALVIANADSSTNEVKNNIFNKSNIFIEGKEGKNIIQNNLTSDAKFVNPASGKFELNSGSPAIDTGISVNAGNLDYSLKNRVINGTIDMGCLEYGSESTGPTPPETSKPETSNPEISKPEISKPDDSNFSSSKYYVSSKGNNKNSGSINRPFKTIEKGISVLKAGDTLLVRGGTYKEKVNMKNSGSSSKGFITVKNYPGETVILKGTNKGGANLSITNKNYIRIEGLNIADNSGNNIPMGISVNGFGTDIQLVNNRIYNITSKTNAHAIGIYGSNAKKPISNLLIEGNEVFNCKLGQSESIVLNGNVTNFKVINNNIHDNDNIAIDFIGYEGTAGSGETDRARNGICSGNLIYNISSIKNPTYKDYGANGIYVDGGKDIIIEKNTIKNCDIGIEMGSERKGKASDNITVRNNRILDSTNYAALVFGGESKSNGTARNIKIYNNTVYNADTALVIANADSSTNEVKNNTFNKVNTIIEGKIGKNIVKNNISSGKK